MTKITIGFSRPQGWFEPFSWLIRLGYWTSYSHSYVKWYSQKYDRNLIFQASGLSINLIAESNFDAKEIVVKEFIVDMSDENVLKMLTFAIDTIGKPYNLKGIVGLIYVRTLQLVGINVKNPFGWDGSCAFCSELVGYCLDQYEGDVVDAGDFANITPKDLFVYLTKLTSATSTSQSQTPSQ